MKHLCETCITRLRRSRVRRQWQRPATRRAQECAPLFSINV
jgi:hypothetical protein